MSDSRSSLAVDLLHRHGALSYRLAAATLGDPTAARIAVEEAARRAAAATGTGAAGWVEMLDATRRVIRESPHRRSLADSALAGLARPAADEFSTPDASVDAIALRDTFHSLRSDEQRVLLDALTGGSPHHEELSRSLAALSDAIGARSLPRDEDIP